MASLGNIIALAVITTLSLMFTLRRVMCWRLIFGYGIFIDVTLSIGLVIFFKGTVSGAASAALSGLLLATFLTAGKWLFGYRRVKISRYRWQLRWLYKDYPGVLRPVKGKRKAGKPMPNVFAPLGWLWRAFVARQLAYRT